MDQLMKGDQVVPEFIMTDITKNMQKYIEPNSNTTMSPKMKDKTLNLLSKKLNTYLF